MELYFIRHGQSINNANWHREGYAESPDPWLTETGKKQVGLLAEYLSRAQVVCDEGIWNPQNRQGFGLTHLYSSLMERAADTAYPVSQALGLPLTAWKDVHEGGGIFTRTDPENLQGLPGKPRSFFKERFPGMVLPDDLDETGWWNRPFEDDDERTLRARRVFAELLVRHGDREGQPEHRVAIVSHGGFFMHFVCAMLDMSYKQASNGYSSWFLLNNCSISRFDIRGEQVLLAYLNRIDFLPDELITG